MLADFSIAPLDKGESLSRYVAKIVEIVESSGLDYKLNSMGTTVEGNWDEVMELIKKCHSAMRQESRRVLTTIRIDDREGAVGRLTGKIESVEKRLGHTVKK